MGKTEVTSLRDPISEGRNSIPRVIRSEPRGPVHTSAEVPTRGWTPGSGEQSVPPAPRDSCPPYMQNTLVPKSLPSLISSKSRIRQIGPGAGGISENPQLFAQSRVPLHLWARETKETGHAPQQHVTCNGVAGMG